MARFCKTKGKAPLVRALLALILFAPVAPTPFAIANEVPEIGKAFAHFSPEDEKLIGRTWLYNESSNLPILINAPLLQDYLNQFCQEMAGYTSLRNLDLKVILLADPSINAFAAPGGVLGINLGLLTSVEHEDELASVIAHEFAHLSQRHALEIIASARNRSALTYGSFLAGLGMLIAGNPAIGFAALFGGMANNANLTLDAVRLNEEEADSIAFDTMRNAGRNPSAALKLMERLYQQNRDGLLPVVFRSHPLSSQRITSLRNRALASSGSAYPATPQSEHNQFNFHVAQMVAGMHLTQNTREYVAQLKANKPRQLGMDKDAYQLGLAAVLNRLGEHQQALGLLEPLYTHNPLHQYTSAEYARALGATGKLETAGRILDQQLLLNPDNYLLNLVQIAYLKTRGDTAAAIALLERMTQRDSENLWLWNTLYQDYGKRQQIAKSHFANGHIHHLLGRNKLAISQFHLARQKTQDARLKAEALDAITTIKQYQSRLETLL